MANALDYPDMQSVFEKITNHLFSMKRQSMTDKLDDCLYLSKDGNKCAVGCIFTHKKYAKIFDDQIEHSTDIKTLYVIYPQFFKNVKQIDIDFLNDMQKIHDSVELWGKSGIRKKDTIPELKKVAKKYKLDINFLVDKKK